MYPYFPTPPPPFTYKMSFPFPLFSLSLLPFRRLKSQTHSGASKRFTLQSDGSFLRRKAGRNHNFAKKDAGSRSNLRAAVGTTKEQTAFIRKLSV